MRKINKNIFVFAFVFMFLLKGVFSKEYILGTYHAIVDNLKSNKSFGIVITNTIADVEAASKQNLTYHNDLINVNSFVLKETGTDVIRKDDVTIVRASNGYLAETVPKISDETLGIYASNVSQLYNYTQNKNIPFLYVMAPRKGYTSQFPNGTDNYLNENCNGFLRKLDALEVPYLNLFTEFEKHGITEENAFFVTDHHWKPDTAFKATEMICQELYDKYGLTYDSSAFDINNFNVKTYENWFLGSQGKKAGLYFTDLGADDIDLITPNFETSFTVSKPLVNESITGSFEQAHLKMDYIEKKDYYNLNPYETYSGGNFHLQTIKNHYDTTGKKILIIRDSFACTVTPFLSLTCEDLHILDLRQNKGMTGERITSVESYIDGFEPDYVIILYSGMIDDSLMYTFELEQ